MHESLVRGVHTFQGLEDGPLDLVTANVGEALPEVLVVALVGQVSGVQGLGGNVPAENDSGKLLGLNSDLSLLRVKAGGHKARVLVRLGALGNVELLFGGLARGVVVGQDLLQDRSDTCEVVCGDSFDHFESVWGVCFVSLKVFND